MDWQRTTAPYEEIYDTSYTDKKKISVVISVFFEEDVIMRCPTLIQENHV